MSDMGIIVGGQILVIVGLFLFIEGKPLQEFV